ncbi:MAG: FAD-dependent oxidoreductase [Phycisphaerales bacterium]|nr:FAD-dependent oxidoreductase [Phycisphaerales bacterium]
MHSHYDLAVIGTGPAGQDAAINAAKMGKRVVAIEREPAVGEPRVVMTRKSDPAIAVPVKKSPRRKSAGGLVSLTNRRLDAVAITPSQGVRGGPVRRRSWR